MTKIVLSYRRGDSLTITSWLYEKLVDRYGKEAVFRDIDSIQPTENFRKRIGRALRDCDFVVAIIGPGWEGRDTDGKSRINSANDWVRVEVETALQLDIPLLPVLVEGAEMPQPDELPSSLREVTEINALAISSGERFCEDLDRLYAAIEKVTGVDAGDGAAPAPEPAGPAVAAPQPAAAPEPASPPPASAPPPQPAPAAAPASAAQGVWPARKRPEAKPGADKPFALSEGRTILRFFVVPSLIMAIFWAYAFLSNEIDHNGAGSIFLLSVIFMMGLGVVMRIRARMRAVHTLIVGGVVGFVTMLASFSTGEINIDREGLMSFIIFVGGGIATTLAGFLLGRFVRSK